MEATTHGGRTEGRYFMVSLGRMKLYSSGLFFFYIIGMVNLTVQQMVTMVRRSMGVIFRYSTGKGFHWGGKGLYMDEKFFWMLNAFIYTVPYYKYIVTRLLKMRVKEGQIVQKSVKRWWCLNSITIHVQLVPKFRLRSCNENCWIKIRKLYNIITYKLFLSYE